MAARGRSTSLPGYMPWVDGLRAISILGVVAFHAGLSSVSGGFAGVDIFFVISGFLIIGQIKTGLEAGHFSTFGFYARRVMRILPPYFLMIVVVSVVAPFLLILPKSFEIEAKAAVLAPLMVSNILFFLEQGYFDAAVEQKPFIHTWTLSVEEQFYLVIPLALILLYRLGGGRFGKRAALLAGVAGIVSFVACVQFTTVVERNPAFYLTPFRAWEFIAGGFALPLANTLKLVAGRRIAASFALTGLGLVGGAFFGMSGTDPFPGWLAAIPVLGAVLILSATTAQPENPVARALSHPVPVRIGLVSYSWYLWHWPLFSLASLADIGPPSWRGVLFAGALGYVAAELSYRFVELPVKAWRHRRAVQFGNGKIFFAGVAGAFAVAVVCGGITGLGYLRNQAWLEQTYGVTPKERTGNGCHVVTEDALDPLCLQGNYALLIGDSHADAAASVFARELGKSGLRLVVLARGGCDPAWFTPEARAAASGHQCANLMQPLEQVLAAKDPPKLAIVISKFGGSYSKDPADVARLAAMFNLRGTPVLFVGPVPIFPKPVLDCVVKADQRGEKRDDCVALRSSYARRETDANTFMRVGISGLPLAAYVPIGDVFCDQSVCRPWDGNKLLFLDTNHVVPSGAIKVFEAIKPKLAALLDGQKRLN